MTEKERHPSAYLIGKLIGFLIVLGIWGFIGWLVVSFIEIIFRNVNPDTVYSAWNFWAMVFK